MSARIDHHNQMNVNNFCLVSLFISMLVLFLPILSDYCLADSGLASEQEMEQVCRNWLSQLTQEKGLWGNSSAPQIIESYTLEQDGHLLARYYSIFPKGFILVPVLKELPPVKAYSMKSNLDSNQKQGFLTLIKEVLSIRVESYLSTIISERDSSIANDEIVFNHQQRKLWDIYTLSNEEFLSFLSKERQPLDEAGPLITSIWHQGEPYHNNCPIDGNGRCKVGCLATAMAQILYYWQWPENGYGSKSYTWHNYYCGHTITPHVISADFSDDYDWDNMVDDCILGCTSAQQQALAELNYEVGISLHSEYGSCVTPAEICPWSYIENFKYSDDIEVEHRRLYDTEGWFGLIKEEVDNNRPMQYQIYNHSIVCDGYRNHGDGLLEYHMNYGWAGTFTTWFVLDDLPCPWCPGGQSPIEHEYLVAHIKPQTKPYIYIREYTLNESDGDGDNVAEPGESLFLTVTIENMGNDAYYTQGELYTSDPYINEFAPPSAPFDTVVSHGDQSIQVTPFLISIDESCPDPHIAIFEFWANADGGYTMVDSIYVFIGTEVGFTDGFESGQGLWSHREFAHGAEDEWHMETLRAHSGSYSWKVGGTGAGIYAVVQDASLISPPFLLPDNAELTFWHWMDSEIGSSSDIAWDGSIVMISTSGRNWTQIYPEGGYPCQFIEFSGTPIGADTPCFSGTHDWKKETFDLSEYSGVAQIMFRFDADALVTQEGWYIDDVSIAQSYILGDANDDEVINVGDAVYLINYVFKGGPAPYPLEAGDADCNSSVNVGDAVYLINYVFKGGPAPDAECP